MVLYCKGAWWSAQQYKYKHIVQDGYCTEIRYYICTTIVMTCDGLEIFYYQRYMNLRHNIA
jgi:uncharacterized membrane protein YwzB